MIRFRWWQFGIVIGLSAGFVVALYAIAEFGRARLVLAAAEAQEAQQQWVRVEDLRRLLVDAEAGHRGFLLTGDESYLDPLDKAATHLEEVAAGLAAATTHHDPRVDRTIAAMRELATSRLSVMQDSVSAYRRDGLAAAQLPADSATHQEAMRQFRELASASREYEQAIMERTRVHWDRELALAHRLNIAALVLGLTLAALAVAAMFRSLRQRQDAAIELEQQRDSLQAQAQAQSTELTELYRHLQHVQEEERARLSRGLHDELGGVLLTARMDVTAMESQPPDDVAALRERLARVRVALDQGIDLKRRVVEELRPTLLDTMGLIAALRWQVEESCKRADLQCHVNFPDDEPAFNRPGAISLFRVVQEALMNIVKHAQARVVHISLALEGDDVVLTIGDDGNGSARHDLGRPRAHGIAGMRHRVQVLGGQLDIETAPGAGMRILVRVPINNVMQSAGADAGTSGTFAAIPWAVTGGASPVTS